MIFIVINLTKRCQKKRLEVRHSGDGGNEWAGCLSKMFDLFEPAGEDEEGAYNLTVTEDMSLDDVWKRVVKVINKIGANQIKCPCCHSAKPTYPIN